MLEADLACGIYRNIEALELLSDLLRDCDRAVTAVEVSGLCHVCRLVKSDLEKIVLEAEKPKK